MGDIENIITKALRDNNIYIEELQGKHDICNLLARVTSDPDHPNYYIITIKREN